MASIPSPAVAVVDKLKSLSPALEQGTDPDVRAQALQLARELVGSLQRPEDVAAELIFSVSDFLSLIEALPCVFVWTHVFE